MLIKIRERSSGFLAYVIVGLLSIPFALWGIQSYFGTLAATVMAVGDMEVDVNQYNEAFLQNKRFMQESLAEGEEPPDERVRMVTLGSIARQLLIEQTTEEYGYRVSDESLAQAITVIPAFQDKDGNFDPQLYQSWLKAEQTSRVFYENDLRKKMRDNQLLKAVAFSSFTLESERENFKQLYNEEREVSYLVLDTDEFIQEEDVSDEDVQNEYDSNKSRYVTDFEFSLRYVDLNAADFFDDESVSDEIANEYYEANKDEFFEPERRAVRYILFDADEHEEEEIDRRVQEVRDKLAAGEDFAELAKEYSDDFLTADDGGELPMMTEFDIEDDAVREAIFTMTEGDVSETLSGPLGMQIFMLAEIVPEEQRGFDEVADEIIDLMKLEAARDRYATLRDELDQLVNSGAAGLFEQAADNFGMVSTTTEWFKQDSREGILKYPVVRRVLFEQILTGEAQNSGLVDIEEGARTVLFAVNDVKQPRQLEFDETKDDIRERLLTDKALVKTGEQRDKWLEQLTADEETFANLADGDGVALESPGYIRRDASADEVPAPVTSAAFGVAYPEDGKPIYLPLEVDGNRAILQLSALRSGEDESPQLSFVTREENAVLESLRDIFKIEVFAENLPQQ